MIPLKKRLSLPILLGAGFVAQLLSIQPLWDHSSDTGSVFGRFSTRYAVVLGIHAVLLVVWLLAFLLRTKFAAALAKLPTRIAYGLIAVSGLAVFAFWFTHVEGQAQQYLALNWLLMALTLIASRPELSNPHPPAPSPSGGRGEKPLALRERGWGEGYQSAVITFILSRWPWLVAGAAVIFGAGLFLSTLTQLPFSPDEAHWADYASSSIVAGGIYSRTWLQEPIKIEPGLSWSVGVYGWVLENVDFSIRTGRIWNFAFYLLAFAGIWAVAARLYGRKAALVSTAFAALSLAFIPVFDYRPDHQLAAASVLVVFLAVQARYTNRAMWHFLCGLAAVLCMELHAASIVFAFGMGLFYVAELALGLNRGRRGEPPKQSDVRPYKNLLRPLLWLGLGMLVGAGIYYLINIAPVGGLSSFVKTLTSQRGERARFGVFLTWPSLLETAVIVGAMAFIAWRRRSADRLFLGMLICIVIGLALLDTQGYRSPVIALYAVPVGALLVDGFGVTSGLKPEATLQPETPEGVGKTAATSSEVSSFSIAGGFKPSALGLSAALAILCLTAVMAGQAVTATDTGGISGWLKSGHLPRYLYWEIGEAVRPFITDADVVASTHLLIWGLPRQPTLVSYAGEVTAMRRWNLTDPEAVWERVLPTVMIAVGGNQMVINPGLQAYLDGHHFQVCQQMQVQNVSVTISRPQCEGTGG